MPTCAIRCIVRMERSNLNKKRNSLIAGMPLDVHKTCQVSAHRIRFQLGLWVNRIHAGSVTSHTVSEVVLVLDGASAVVETLSYLTQLPTMYFATLTVLLWRCSRTPSSAIAFLSSF